MIKNFTETRKRVYNFEYNWSRLFKRRLNYITKKNVLYRTFNHSKLQRGNLSISTSKYKRLAHED